MKKNIFKTLGLLTFAALITYNVNLSKAENPSSASLTSLGKVALADCESTVGYGNDWKIKFISECQWDCTHGGTNSCPL